MSYFLCWMLGDTRISKAYYFFALFREKEMLIEPAEYGEALEGWEVGQILGGN